MNTIQNNILNYTVGELMKILNIDSLEDLNENSILEGSNFLINQSIRDNNYSLAEFYEEVKNKLLEFVEKYNFVNEDEDEDEDKSINEQYVSEIKKGEINPLVNKTEKRFLVLDSQYLPENIAKTNYVANLSEKIKRIINIKLHSYSIPFNWYLISNIKRNNILYFLLNDGSKEIIKIEEGNYDINDIVNELNLKIKTKISEDTNTVSYNQNTGKIIFNLYGKQVNSQTIKSLIFFDKNEPFSTPNDDNIFSTLRSYKNFTLGWILGFRKDEITIKYDGNISETIPDLKGPKYLYLVIDDYKRNHTTNNLVTITNIDENIAMPIYYNNDMPLDCNQETLTLLPSAPRTLTQAQIYTINEVMKHKNRTNYFSTSPNESDILAIIPLKHNGLSIGDRIVEMSGQLQDNKREYNGPVDLDRIGVRLIDDSGFIVDLNGSDWTFTLIYEYIYQY